MSIIALAGTGAEALPFPEAVHNQPVAHLRQTLIGEEAIAQVWLPICEGGYDLTSSSDICHAVYIGSNGPSSQES